MKKERVIPIKEKVNTIRVLYLEPGIEITIDDRIYKVVRITGRKLICKCVDKVR